MAIPDYQQIMLPVLKFAADEKEHTSRETIDHLAVFFKLTDDERKELLPSETQNRFDNRVHWARSYMKQAGLITNPSRGIYKITKRGKDVLASAPSELSVDYLMRFPEFVEFRTRAKKTDGEGTTSITNLDESKTPKEHLEDGYQKLRGELVSEILVTIKSCSPDFFENLVVELLIKMGYGGSRKDAGRAIGKSGDGGIDGIINEDRLGLDIIYIQAKRWESTVGRPEIQKFVGALHGKRARKGVFITTANYSKEAADYVAGIDSKVVLIDGEHLAQLMIDFDLGVSKVASYEIKKIDSDYFVE